MPIRIVPNCFPRRVYLKSTAEIGCRKLVRDMLKASVGSIKKCFGLCRSESAPHADGSVVTDNDANDTNISHTTSNGSSVQAAVRTSTASTVNAVEDITISDFDSRDTTESVYALSINTASLQSLTSSTTSERHNQPSVGSSTESAPLSSETYSSAAVVSTVAEEDLTVRFHSNVSSVIRFVSSIAPLTRSSSTPDVDLETIGIDAASVSSNMSSPEVVVTNATLNLASLPVREVTVDGSGSTVNEVTRSKPARLETLLSRIIRFPQAISSSYRLFKCPQIGRLKYTSSLPCSPHRKCASLVRNSSAPQVFAVPYHEKSLSRPDYVSHTAPSQETQQNSATLHSSIIAGSEVVAITNYSLTTGWDSPDSLVACKVGEVLVPESTTVYNDSYKGTSFTVLSSLGSGAFGTVVLVVDNLGHRVALKALPSAEKRGKRARERLSREVEAQMSVQHRNSVKLFATFSVDTRFFLVLEYAENGSLSSRIARTGGTGLDSPFVAQVTLAVASALQVLHSNGFVHRDVKPGNIVLGNDDKARVCDFGISGRTGRYGPCKTYCGTKNYCAPEVDGYRPYDETVDLWSLGVVIFEMLTGTLPFGNSGKMTMDENVEWPVGSTVDEGALDLIRRLLRIDPRERLPLSKVCTHPWVLQHAHQPSH